jgi:hypothetical protein
MSNRLREASFSILNKTFFFTNELKMSCEGERCEAEIEMHFSQTFES